MAKNPSFPDGFPFSPRTPDAVAAQPASPDPAPAAATLTGRERRRSPRQTLVAKAVIRPDVSVMMPSLVTTGFVSNISMGGVGFHTRRPLAVGDKYRLNLELGPMKWASRMRVVSCTQHSKSGTFDVGAEFVGNDLMSRSTQIAA